MTNPKPWRATDVAAYLPEPRTTRRGRVVDEATRLSLLTPEQRAELQRQQEERDRQYEEAVRLRRMEIESNFYGYFDGINYRTFFDVPVTQHIEPPPTLEQRLNAALNEADRCARQGDNMGRLHATTQARHLRRQLMQSQLFPQFV